MAALAGRGTGAAHGRAHRHLAGLANGRRARRVRDFISWRPTASLAVLRQRAQALATTREFFRARQVLEVETPALVNSPVSDINMGSVQALMPGTDRPLYLHTSPEYAMKRLLAA